MPESRLHIAYIMEATAGGSRKHLRHIVQVLRARGQTVDLLLSAQLADPDFSDDLELYRKLGCTLYLIDMAKHLRPSDWRACRQLRTCLEHRQPDIVHTHCAKAGLLGRLAASRATPDAMIVHTPHSYFFEGLRNPLAKRAGIALERWLNRRTDLVFCISEAERQLIRQHQLIDDQRVAVGVNGLPESFYDSLQPRDYVRAELNIPADAMAIGIFSRLVPKKGHLWFLDAIRQLPPDQLAKVRVYLFGEGPLAGAIQARIANLQLSDYVFYLGYRPQAEQYLPGMDLAVLPSYYEGLPYQLLEALGAGLPLIATDIPGNHLRPDDNPILYVAPDDSAQLASMIEALTGHALDRQRLGARGKRWVRRHFSLDRQVDTLLAAYRRGLQNRKHLPVGKKGGDQQVGQDKVETDAANQVPPDTDQHLQ